MTKRHLTVEDLYKITPKGNQDIINSTVEMFNNYADEFDIDTPLRKSHFLAQIAHESDHFRTTTEYGVGKNKRYWPFIGRGLIQLTWQANYAEFYEWCVNRNLDPPEFFRERYMTEVAEFPWAFHGAVWYWDTRNLNRYADEDDVRRITRIINGGYNGLDDRIKYLNIAKKIFGVTQKDVDGPAGTNTTTFTVRQVQQALVDKGIKIAVDGIMGNQTVNAVKKFQKDNGLVPDGIIGQKTARILFG